MSNKPERFLVTGAGGCIGAWAARCLLDEGAEVIATDLSEDLRRFRLVSHPKAEEKLEFVRLDVTDTKAVTDLVAEREVTHIVHLAGLQVPFCAANPPLGAMVNVVGTVNIFEAARHAGRPVGLVYASSAAVFGSGSFFSSGIVGDTSPLLPENLYGVYKVANEGTARIYALDHGVGSIGLRPFVVYGPGRDQGMTSESDGSHAGGRRRRALPHQVGRQRAPHLRSRLRPHVHCVIARRHRVGRPGMLQRAGPPYRHC